MATKEKIVLSLPFLLDTILILSSHCPPQLPPSRGEPWMTSFLLAKRRMDGGGPPYRVVVKRGCQFGNLITGLQYRLRGQRWAASGDKVYMKISGWI